MQTVQEIYTTAISPLGENEKLQLATLILRDVTQTRNGEPIFDENPFAEKNVAPETTGGIRELFGSASLGRATGADNESIDRDLAREYGDNHQD